MLEEVLTRQAGLSGCVRGGGAADETTARPSTPSAYCDPAVPVEPAQLRRLAIDELGEVYERRPSRSWIVP